MARKAESQDTSLFLSNLQQKGYFRNITDLVQVGIPDIIGCHLDFFYGLEVKSVKSIAENGLAPRRNEHRFTSKQIEELKSIEKSGGLGVGVIICGKILFFGYPHEINEYGQMDCNKLKEQGRFILKKGKKWDLEKFFSVL